MSRGKFYDLRRHFISCRCQYGHGCTYRLRTLEARYAHAKKHLDLDFSWCNDCGFFIKADMFVSHRCKKAGQ